MATPFKRIILAGGGHAHLGVLAAWAKAPPPDTDRVLVTTSQYTAYSGMLPGWMAGIYSQDEILIDLAPLAARAGARLILADVTGLDADAGWVMLATGERLAFDILSLATGGEIDTTPLAATGARLLPVRPVPEFMNGWQAALAARPAADFDVAVVGGGAGGFEIACAAQAALQHKYGAGRVALVTARGTLLAGHARTVAAAVANALNARGIKLIEVQASGHPHGLALAGGEILSAGLVIAATGSRAPGWIAGSGLAVTDDGFVAVGADLASISHPHIFAAGDIIARQDRPLPRSGVHAVKSGPVLAANIAARLAGTALAEYQPPAHNLYLMATGDHRAILSWGPVGMGGDGWAGGLLWQLKKAIDSSFMRRQTK